MPPPRLLGLATQLPPFRASQKEVKELALEVFADLPHLQRLSGVFEHAGVDTRYGVRPMEWYRAPHGFAERNQIHFEEGGRLAVAAGSEALRRAGIGPEQVGAVILISSSGIAAPGIETTVLRELGIDRGARRIPIFGLGCAGGVAGLALASQLVRGAESPLFALVLAVEVNTVSLLAHDLSKSQFVASCLFGDGAAAAVVGPGSRGIELLASFSRILEDSIDLMGWDITDHGFKVRFSGSIPQIVTEHCLDIVDRGLRKSGIARQQLKQYVLHPGGARVLQSYLESLQLQATDIAGSTRVLRDFGNMSSPTVLFVLEETLKGAAEAGDLGLMLALGPGFSAEGLTFRH